MDPQSEHSSGLFASLKRMGRSVLAMAENRIELFLVELQDERVRFIGALLLVENLCRQARRRRSQRQALGRDHIIPVVPSGGGGG